MDMNKLCDKIIKDESIKDIPAIFVLRVSIALMKIINSGECFFDSRESSAYVD